MVVQPLTDQYDQVGLIEIETASMQTPMIVTREVEQSDGRGGTIIVPTDLGPFLISYSPITTASMPRVLEDQAQGRIAYWLKYPLGLDVRPTDRLTIRGHLYTLANEFDPPPNERVQVGVMWRNQNE